MTNELNDYLKTLCNFLDNRKHQVSLKKCSVTLHTPNTREHNRHPAIHINGTALSLAKTPKLLGVTFDTSFTFTTHCKDSASKARRRVNIMKALSGTTWARAKKRSS
jgi:hypothetical protein